MWPTPQETADLVTSTEESFHFLRFLFYKKLILKNYFEKFLKPVTADLPKQVYKKWKLR